jgi:hypothetical protein
MELERHQRLDDQIPIMAALTSLTVVMAVFQRLPAPITSLSDIEDRVRAYRDVLSAIDRGDAWRVARVTIEELQVFFRELQAQGNRTRHAQVVRGMDSSQGDFFCRTSVAAAR